MKYQRNISRLEKMDIDWMGLIFYPRSPRYVRHRLNLANNDIKKIGVFVDATQDFTQHQIDKYKLSGLQFHGTESVEHCAKFNDQKLIIIKAFSVDENFEFSVTETYEEVCDYFLFDTKGEAPGGTGRTFSWQLLEHYKGDTPFLLSGGLGLEQIKDLKAFKHPKFAGVDVNSRFETKPGYKKIKDLKRFKHEFFS